MSKNKKNSDFKKGKKALNNSEATSNWYEQAKNLGYLNQEPKNTKADRDTGNRLDQDSLTKLAQFKVNLETQQAKEKKEAIAQAKKKAKEEEKNTHWYELAEKQGYLD